MTKRKSIGSIEVEKIYDGSIRGVENNKTVGIVLSKEDVIGLSRCLLEYIETGTEAPVDLTFFKRQKQNGKFPGTITYRD